MSRLEEIKSRIDPNKWRDSLHLNIKEEIEWLISRVKELEEENAGLHDILVQIEYQEKDKLLAENKRYRESLVFINEELEFVLHSNKGFAEKVFYIENSKRKITEALEENNEPR